MQLSSEVCVHPQTHAPLHMKWQQQKKNNLTPHSCGALVLKKVEPGQNVKIISEMKGANNYNYFILKMCDNIF